MEFKSFHNDFFRAICGAYSRITSREYYDSQITLTDNEADIVINYFGYENINVGNVGSDKNKYLKKFLLYNAEYQEYNPIYLNLVFPKPAKPELRLYLAESRGYKPN